MTRRLRALVHRLLPPSGARCPLLVIAAACLAVELAILAGTAVGSGEGIRLWVADRLGFWPGLLEAWRPQSVWMFLTYWLVHTGPVHLLGNLAVLAWIAPRLSPRLYPVDLWNIWTASVVGGGVAFALLGDGTASMVGASAGLFGLLGALIVLGYRYTSRTPELMRAAARRTALVSLALVALSVCDVLIRGPVYAWEAHLGGLLSGGLIAAFGPHRESFPSRRTL